MANVIHVTDLNKEFDLDIKIDYKQLKLLDSIANAHSLPYGYFKQAIVHTNPQSTLMERIFKKCRIKNNANSVNATIVLKCTSSSPGFSYYSLFVFYTDDLDKVKKLFKYYKMRAFI